MTRGSQVYACCDMIRKRNNNGCKRQQASLPLSATTVKNRSTKNNFGAMVVCSSLLCILLVILGGTFIIYTALPIITQNKSHPPNRRKRSEPTAISIHNTIKYINLPDTSQYDVVVVGCGPAGISAALFASRMGMTTLVLGSPSQGSLSGTDRIDNFPSFFGDGGQSSSNVGGQAWIDVTIDQAFHFGTQFAPPTVLATGITQRKMEQHTMLEVQTSTSKAILGKTVIIASGSVPNKLNLQHETALWGSSLHNCALCDGDVYVRDGTKKSVAVIGGGDAAVEAVFLLHKLGVDKIHWIHRREEYRASQVDVERVKQLSNVEVWNPFVVVEWIAKERGGSNDVGMEYNPSSLTLEGIRIVGASNGVADLEATSYLTIPCDGAFLMIGSTPNSQWLQNSGIDIDPTSKLIRLSQTTSASKHNSMPQYSTATSIQGVFASGEVVDDIYRQALTASADGAKAAIDAQRYLRTMGMEASTSKHNSQTIAKRQSDLDTQQQPKMMAKHNELVQKGPADCDLTKTECIKQVVTNHPVVVFSKSYCPHCRRALEAIRSFATHAGFVEPLVIDLTELQNFPNIQDTLASMTGRRTVPNVYIGGSSIGGGDETIALLKSGKLEELLNKAGAIQ